LVRAQVGPQQKLVHLLSRLLCFKTIILILFELISIILSYISLIN
jgi:hypothetical protein